MSKIIERKRYLDKVIPFMNKGLVKVFVGQRRVGKSYLLKSLIEKISQEESDANVIYINKELHEFSNMRTNNELVAFVNKKTIQGKKTYLFIDEVQEILGFEKGIRHFLNDDSFDIYCTGSNASMLSGELATLLTGRYIEIRVHGLSYSEFLLFHNLKDNNDSLYKYLEFGGLPYLKHLPLESEVVFDYLTNIYNSIILKDVVSRFNLRNVEFLNRLVEFLAEHCGSLISAKKISDFLKSQKINISTNVVLNYSNYLGSAYFISKIKRQNIVGKKIFEIGEKFYFEDVGLRNTVCGFKQTDINKIIENVVFNHLSIQGYKITIGKYGDKEIDFIAEKKGEKIYIQVAYLIPDEKVREREFGNLLKISDNYPKFVVSLDEPAGGVYQGIKHIHLREFLLADANRL